MNRFLFLLGVMVSSFVSQAKEIEIIPINPARESFVPGKSYTFVFKVVNASLGDVIVSPELNLPENWNNQNREKYFFLKGQTSEIRIVNIHIPPDCSPGKYSLHYCLKYNNNADSLYVEQTIPVIGVQKIKISVIEYPSYVLAGNRIEALFSVRNEGNSSENLEFEVSGGKVDGESVFSIPPMASKIVRVFSDTDKNINVVNSRIIKVKAKITDSKDELSWFTAFTQVEIVPLVEKQEDVFFRFPVRVSVNFLSRQRSDKFYSGLQGEIYGKGYLDVKKKKQLEFLAVGPNRFDLSVLGRYDQYYARYKTPGLSVFIGDKVFSTSPLTEFSRYGRGAEIVLGNKKFETGAYWQMPRFYSGIKNEFSTYLKYDFCDITGIKAGYLGKFIRDENETAHLYTISGWLKPFKGSLLEAEFSGGKLINNTGTGLLLKGNLEKRKFNLSFSYLTTGKNYPGYYSNTSQGSANASYRLSKKISLNLNYHQDALNPRQDTLFGIAPSNKGFRGGLGWQYKKNGTLSLYGGKKEHQDQLSASMFHYKDNFIRGAVYHQLGHFNLSGEGELAGTNNLSTAKLGKSWLVSSEVAYSGMLGSLSVFGNFENTSRYSDIAESNFIYGIRINYKKTDRTEVNLDFQNAYSIEEYYRDRSLLSIRLKQKIDTNHYLELVGNCALMQKQLDQKDVAVGIKYTVQINTPLSRTVDFGELTGFVSDEGAGHVGGIRLFCGGHSAVTNESGEFRFRNIAPGKYYLLVDQSTLKIHDIPNVRQPIELKIVPGINHFSFGLTVSSKISGQVLLLHDEISYASLRRDENQTGNVIIELTREDDEIRRKQVVLGADFVFDNLRPGQWKVLVRKSGLVDSYRVTTDEFDVSLLPGGNEQLSITVHKRAKEIKFMQNEMKVSYNTQ